MMASRQQLLIWILSFLPFAGATEDSPCPNGGRIHLPSLRCYWVSETACSWAGAQHSCRETPGGDVASAESPELLKFIHASFPGNTTLWVWMKDEESSDQDRVLGCAQIALGTVGQWRRAPCAGRYFYLCEKDVTEALPPADSYLTGVVLMSGVYAETRIHPLPSIPDMGQRTIEMQLFPGLWFSHAGQLVQVKLVVQPSPLSSLARIQILRPYCDPSHHLVPPGCSSLLNPFSCCSPVPLCNTTGGCSVGQYWCHLLEVCVPITRPCSPYDSSGRAFALPPRYPEIPPFYHLVADLSLRINPSSELKAITVNLPETAIMVFPDDIVGVQHTRHPGTLLHCLNTDASLNSPWRQSYLSLRGPEWGGWWQGGLTSLSQKGQWVDGVLCDLRILYIDTLHGGTELSGLSGFTHMEETTAPNITPLVARPTPDPSSRFKLRVIHPLLDKHNQIHVQINTPTLIVVKILSGQSSRSSWSAPLLQTGVPFLPSCPEELVSSWPGCKKQSGDEWFSSTTLLMPLVGVQTLNVSVVDPLNAQTVESVSVKLCGYEAVTGLSVEPCGCRRMLVDTPQLFTASVEGGSSVKITWVVDNLERFAYEGDSYSVAFKNPAEYRLMVTASNPVSSESEQILLIADEIIPLAESEFLFVEEVVAVNATHLYTVRVKADISMPVTFRWDFGDGSKMIVHNQSAPCETMNGLVERGERQVYVQDVLNYTYTALGDFTLQVQVSNQYSNVVTSMKIHIRPVLKHIHVTYDPSRPLVNHSLLLEASVEASTDDVFYIWDFGDDSKAVQGMHHKAQHTFGSAGFYNVTVRANNTLASLTTWIILEVLEKISGLSVSYSNSSEVNSVADFRAKVATGTNLIWSFDFGDATSQENLTDNVMSHIYKSAGNYTVVVTVSNSVSKVQQSLTVEVYRVTVSGVLPTDCVLSGKDIQFSALVTGQIPLLTFHWQFGDRTPLAVVTGQSTVTHSFPSPGIFHLNLIVFSSVKSVAFNTSVCVEAPIAHMAVEASQVAAAIGEDLCFRVFVSPDQVTGYQFRWFHNSLSLAPMTENSEKCLVFEHEGVQEVSVVARNKVSYKTANVDVTIQKPVSKLSVMLDGKGDTFTVNTPVSFSVANCSGSNLSVSWDFGDGSPAEQKMNVSHIFTWTGLFTITVTATNLVSSASASVEVSVVNPVVDLSLYTNQSHTAVGEEILITALSSATQSTTFYWTVDGLTSTEKGAYQFKYAFLKAGVYQVKVMAVNLVSRREAAILIEVLERIEGLQIECRSLTNMKYQSTKEQHQFVASVTKGSNVTYHWFSTQSGIPQETTGEHFRLLVDTPGKVLVDVTASNKLGDTTKSLSVVAVERVSSAHVAATSDIVAFGKIVNISVSVDTGSDLQYLWYVNDNSLPLKTHMPFLISNFTSLGVCPVTVIVQNVLSQCNDTKEFTVQEEVQEVDFEIDGKIRPFYIDTNTAVSVRGVVHKGSDLHWHWEVRDAEHIVLNAANQTFFYTFTRANSHEVTLNVSNKVSWQMVSHMITVQDGITGLELSISKFSLCSEEEVTIVPSISKGTNVSFVITFKNKDWIQSQSVLGRQYSTSSLQKGSYQVTVTASNLVSSAEVSSSITVAETIRGLRLVNCCSAALEGLKANVFRAEVPSGLLVNYTWTFYSTRLGPVRYVGQEVTVTPTESGAMVVSVFATNGGCSLMLNDTVLVEWPIQMIQVVCHSERTFAGHSSQFSAEIQGGSNVTFIWDFGDSTKALMTAWSVVNHTYHFPGEYTVVLNVSNSVSHMTSQLHLTVEDLRCSSPEVSFIHSHFITYRSRVGFFEAHVDNNCSTYKTNYQWDIFKASDCARRDGISWSSQVETASPVFLLPKHTFDVGQYCLVLTVTLQGTPLSSQQTATITVLHSPLVAIIKGGSRKVWSSLSELILDGSESQDPDGDPGMKDSLQYEWTFMEMNSTETNFVEPIGSNSSRLTVPANQLSPGTVYVFSLTVHKAGRDAASINQTLTVCDAPVVPVTVACLSCSALSSSHYISDSTAVILAGQCGQCDGRTEYEWSADAQTGKLELDAITTSTGRHSPNLVVRPSVLQPGLIYTFTLRVTQPGGGGWGSASQTVLFNNPPHGGLCDIGPESDIRVLETVVTYNCSGWQDDESDASQLIYTFQVAPCQPVSPMCPALILYRGTRSSFGSLLPFGRSGRDKYESLITVTLLVEDHLGSKAVALNRSLTVLIAARDQRASQWLRNKSQTELWALVQHGNPQEILPYCIALASQLNQMEAERSDVSELADTREIRRNVTDALASLPVSSLLDVDQISSALAQATAFSSELVPGESQGKILESVETMIRVMEEQMSPGVLSAVETGRNVLNILGSLLAAMSDSGSSKASRSQAANTRSALPPSSSTMSALARSAALMRSLMQSRVGGEEPLLLSNPHLSAVGFRGDPDHLYCSRVTDRSGPPCRFQIPRSLAARLRSQGSEVVQVLLGTDAAPGDPPISTSLAGMELSTPEGQPVPVRDLEPGDAIRVTLPRRSVVEPGDGTEGTGAETCVRVMMPDSGRLDFTVDPVDDVDSDSGLFVSFTFSSTTGSVPVSLGRVRIEASVTVGTNSSLQREWLLNLSAEATPTEEAIFVSPLFQGAEPGPLSVSLTSSLPDGSPVQPSVSVSVCVFSSVCRFYSAERGGWSSEGVRPLEGSSLQETHCLTRHLTVFGASLFLHPGAVVLLPPSGGPVRNSLVGIVCAVLLLTHLLLGLIAHKLDHVDGLRLSRVPLCGRPGLNHYRVLIKTGRRRGAGTTAHVGIGLYGVGKSGSRHLQGDGAFQRGSLDQFHMETDENLGEIWKIRIWHDNTGLDPSWYVQHVVVWDVQTDHMFFFLLEDWLSVENQRNETVERDVLASCPEELTRFGRVLRSQLLWGAVERHLWLSLWERPLHSGFSRGQRVTCSAAVLHLYLALGALWYGAVGSEGNSAPVSSELPLDGETVAVGATVAALVFPLQCFLHFLFRKTHSQVSVDVSVPPSPVCHSVEMDVHLLGHTGRCSASFLSLPDASSPGQESPSSYLESKVCESSILDFWAASGLVPGTDDSAYPDRDAATWSSCDSLLPLPADWKLRPLPEAPPTRQLRRKKALTQLRLATPSLPDAYAVLVSPPQEGLLPDRWTEPVHEVLSTNANPAESQDYNLSTFLTLSEEDLLMSIAAAAPPTGSNSDSGRDSPRTTSSFSATQSPSCSSWSDHSVDQSDRQPESPPYPAGLYKSPSVFSLLSVDSVASTFLPSASPLSTRSHSPTRIGVPRGQLGWLLPPWTLRVVYPLVAVLLGGCCAVVGLYGSAFSRTVVLMWLVSALSAFLTSALLLEPVKVCLQALVYTVLWRPVDPEVEDLLAQETTVVRALGDQSAKVRPPCGYGLLQAKDEARKVRALRCLMRHCVCQLLFLLLALMVNYQDSVEHRHGRLLQSAIRSRLHAAPPGVRNLSSIRDWSDTEQWISHTLVPFLHQNPSLRLVGSLRLQLTDAVGHVDAVTFGNSSETTRQLFDDLRMTHWSRKPFRSVSIDFTQYHRESALFVCVSVQLEWTRRFQVTHQLPIRPLLIPSSSSGLDLRVALTVLLLVSGIALLFGEAWSMATERAQYLHRSKHWLQLLVGLLSLVTAILQFCFLSAASSCLHKLRSQPDGFVSFCSAALLARSCSECAAVLLTLLILKLLGTLRFVRRWQVIVRVLQRARGKLWALTASLLLLLTLCTHLGNTLFSYSVEGFLFVNEAGSSVLSILCGRRVLQRLCRVHTVLGPLFGLLVKGGGLWVLGRLCGAVLIQEYRAEQAELYQRTIEPQDYEMVEFFIKRLKLWMGLTKAKEFRHRVKFEGMEVPPSRSSQESRLSTLSSAVPSYCSPSLSSSFSSPRPMSSVMSVRSEDSSGSESGSEVSPHLDRLAPSVAALLSCFDRVNQVTMDVHILEMRLEEVQSRRRRRDKDEEQGVEGFEESTLKPKISDEGIMAVVRDRKTRPLHPTSRVSLPSSSFTSFTPHSAAAATRTCARAQRSHSESESVLPTVSNNHTFATTKPTAGIRGSNPTDSPQLDRFPRRKAWHSGSSHSTDAAQRDFQLSGVAFPCDSGRDTGAFMNSRPRSEEGARRSISDRVPVKRKAWISDGDG